MDQPGARVIEKERRPASRATNPGATHRMGTVTRRTAIALAAAPFLRAARLPIKKAVEFDMLPPSISILDRFRLARECGFEQIECPTTPDWPSARRRNARGIEDRRSPDPLGNESGALAQSAFLRRSGRRRQEPRRNAYQPPATPSCGARRRSFWCPPSSPPTSVTPKRGSDPSGPSRLSFRRRKNWASSSPSRKCGINFCKARSNSPVTWTNSTARVHVRAYFDVGNVAINEATSQWIDLAPFRAPESSSLHIKDFRFRAHPDIDGGTFCFLSA